MYYNNGITVICNKIDSSCIDTSNNRRIIPLVNPQIVNGCQTVSSIKTVLENYVGDVESAYKNVYVMVKALVIDNPNEGRNKNFYNNVVKFTNKQTAISEKAFTSKEFDVFYRLHDEFEKRGFWLAVKPSDANKFSELPLTKKSEMLTRAKKEIDIIRFDLSVSNICIPLEKLLQVFIAFVKNGYMAFTKKNLVLAQGKEIFDLYCSNIHSYLTVENMIKIYYVYNVYKRAEYEQKKSEDKRTPIPYYIIGFMGSLIGEKNSDNIQKALNSIFSSKECFEENYRYLSNICKFYRMNYERDHKNDGSGEYNIMIKRPIDESALHFSIETAEGINEWVYVKKWRSANI